MELLTTKNFNGVQLDCYKADNADDDFWATREQIGRLLEYVEPRIAIAKIHQRNQDRLDKFSGVVKLVTPEGGTQETTVYNFKGLLEICRYSNQPKANAVMDFLWNIADEIRQTYFYIISDKIKDILADPDSFIKVLEAYRAERAKLQRQFVNDLLKRTGVLPLAEDPDVQSLQAAIQAQQTAEEHPKADYYDIVLQCEDLVSLEEISKDYGWSLELMNVFLFEQGVHFKHGDAWLIQQKYAECGYTKTKPQVITDTNGDFRTKTHTYWTQKGRLFIYELMKKAGHLPLIEQGG